ncbi:L-2,4-diaminobutyrate decarboxylase [Actinospica durhamensis]|uniref:L-2,4-diaminobutyrate decarboxylase n=1 Tax=Actinospica durhamensis TaxID=1508375 RepID=A0A941EPB1_9ACTN|nr:pyridoxal-dependent decarboxylase [Actinospica durhamensis]MBR7834775.1 L-2,4-diaminobutyrate decarboxylase [Actinospica durhamensis]
MNWTGKSESGESEEASALATAEAYDGVVAHGAESPAPEIDVESADDATAEPPTVADLLPSPAGDDAAPHQDGSALLQMLGALVPAPTRPLPPGSPAALAERVRREFTPVLPEVGLGPASFDALAAFLPEQTVRAAHPRTVAHLHCPPDPVAMAADTLVGALNPSQDSWDQSAAPSAVEDEVLAAFSALAFGAPGAGSVTSGGTESNHLALLLARDEAVRRGFGLDPAEAGLPAAACGRLRILASSLAHFSLARAAAQLGLGERAVIPVPVLADHRLDPRALMRIAAELSARGERIAAVVATAGTTDAGAVDPLAACAQTARAHGAWFHVDAAYAGGLLLSDVRRPLLTGLELADSVSVDLHKLGWQTIPAGLLLTRDPAALAPISRRVAYLSDLDDEAEGYPNLLGRSLRTTRRADAVKILAACRHHGRAGYTRMIESCFGQAAYVAARFEADPRFELALPPALTTVLFRYRARQGDPDRVNAAVRRDLLAAGLAVIGRTRLPEPGSGPGSLRLKLTLLRPQTTAAELDALLDLIARTAAERDRPET